MEKIAIIPARSGSKGLKNKNILNLCGKPMIAYTIEAALQCSDFKEVIVSTDSDEYAKIAKQYGAKVLIRPDGLAGDDVPSYKVIEDVFARCGLNFDFFVLLQPTSPMRTNVHIKEALNIFENGCDDFDFLVSVKLASSSSALTKPIDSDMSMKFFDTDFSEYKRQNYLEYSPNGAIFIGKPDAYLRRKHFFGERSCAYIMDKLSSVDVDDIIDFEIASFLMQKYYMK